MGGANFNAEEYAKKVEAKAPVPKAKVGFFKKIANFVKGVK